MGRTKYGGTYGEGTGDDGGHVDFPEFEGLALRDALSRLGDGNRVSIGAATGYLFIGTKGEFIRSAPVLDGKWGRGAAPGEYVPFLRRRVKSSFLRWTEGGGTAFIVEGKEYPHGGI